MERKNRSIYKKEFIFIFLFFIRRIANLLQRRRVERIS